MSGQTILDQIASHKDKLRKLGVTRVGVFGSAIRGDARKTSDIDLLVEYDSSKKTYRNFFGTATFMEELLGQPVDLVTPQSLSPYIKPHILKEVRYVEIAG